VTFSSPKVNIDIIPAGSRIKNTDQKVLLVGQMIRNNASDLTNNPIGTFDPVLGTLVTNVPDDEVGNNALYGPRSIIAAMIREARKVNPVTRIDAFVLPDSTVDSNFSYRVTFFTGTATENGTATLVIGSKINHTFSLNILKGDSVAVISAGLPPLINADLTVPVVATDFGAGQIDLLTANRGLEAENLTIKILALPPGITAVTAVPNILPGGTPTNPTLTNIFTDIGDKRYQTIVWPETYDQNLSSKELSYKILIDELETRFNLDNVILDGQGIISLTLSVADHTAQAQALDTRVISIYANRFVFNPGLPLPQISSAIAELNYVIASQIGAIRGLRLTEGADISRFVTSTSGALDNFGGPALASLPYFNTPFDLLPVIIENGFSNIEIKDLQAVGLSMLENNDADTKIVSLDAETLYKTNATGNPDKSFFFLNAVDTMSNVREYFFNNLKSRYAQSRLTEGDLIRDRNQANERSIKAFMSGLYQDLAGSEFVLTQLGENATKFFKDNLEVTLDLEAGKVIIFALIPIVTQLREIVGELQLSFSVNG